MNKIPLIENACKELLEYGVRGWQEKGKDLAKRLLLRRKTPEEDPIFWTTGILAAGLWACREESAMAGGHVETAGASDGAVPVERIDRALAAYYERWLKKGMPLRYVDDLLAGETLLNMYRSVREKGTDFGVNLSEDRLKGAADRLASYAADHAVDGAGSFLYRPAGGEKTVFVDGIGLACPYLYQYGEAFDRQEYSIMAMMW